MCVAVLAWRVVRVLGKTKAVLAYDTNSSSSRANSKTQHTLVQTNSDDVGGKFQPAFLSHSTFVFVSTAKWYGSTA